MFLVVLRLHSVVFQWRQYIATPLWIEKHKNGFYTLTLCLNWNIMRNTEMRKPQAKASLQIASLMNPGGHHLIVWKPERTSSSRGILTNPRLMADLTRNLTTAGGRKKVSSGKNSQKDQDYASEPNVRLTWYKNLCSPQAHRSTTTTQTNNQTNKQPQPHPNTQVNNNHNHTGQGSGRTGLGWLNRIHL